MTRASFTSRVSVYGRTFKLCVGIGQWVTVPGMWRRREFRSRDAAVAAIADALNRVHAAIDDGHEDVIGCGIRNLLTRDRGGAAPVVKFEWVELLEPTIAECRRAIKFVQKKPYAITCRACREAVVMVARCEAEDAKIVECRTKEFKKIDQQMEAERIKRARKQPPEMRVQMRPLLTNVVPQKSES